MFPPLVIPVLSHPFPVRLSIPQTPADLPRSQKGLNLREQDADYGMQLLFHHATCYICPKRVNTNVWISNQSGDQKFVKIL